MRPMRRWVCNLILALAILASWFVVGSVADRMAN